MVASGARHRQAGRTNTHTVVMLVIYGMVLVGATLAGTELLALVRSFTQRLDVEAVRSMVLRYHVDFQALPGDDPRAAARWGRSPAGTLEAGGAVVDRTGNGRWDGRLLEPGHETAEPYAAWEDLRAAGLWEPTEEQTARVGLGRVPPNRFGGVMTFASDVLGLRTAVCLTQVPADRAGAMDRALDDGDPAAGQVRAARPAEGWTTPLRNQSLRVDGLSFDQPGTLLLCASVDPL